MNQKILVTIFLAGILSCTTTKKIQAPDKSPQLVVQGPLWGAVWQQRASEYRALCYQAYNTARLQLDLILQKAHKRPLAVVTDIDETVLDNSPYQVHIAEKNEEYADASWIEWTKRIDCDTVPGALSFFNYAKSKGVAVFYITNRLEQEREQTLKDLQRWNFPDATNDHLILKTAESGKGPRRDIVSNTHDIVMLFGDNLSDFSAAFDKRPEEIRNTLTRQNADLFGSRFIVLPNAMYGDWESMLYEYKHELSPAAKDKQILQKLKRY